MTFKRANLVLTTIYESEILQAYRANAARYGHLEQVRAYVIPDRKTPASVAARCREMTESGFECSCPSLEEQESFLRSIGLPCEAIPYNSDNRRNVGFLMALQSGADFMVSIDDDNFCTEDTDFIGAHAIVTGPAAEHQATESKTGFLNICAMLDMERPGTVYARGFPYFARHREEAWTESPATGEIHVNAGLWLHEPDVDAMTWLIAPPKVRAMQGPSVVLGQNSWSPVNSQNTAMRQCVIPAYYFVRMGYPISGMTIDRYGDIFSGYFTEACAKRVGGGIRFGTPVANHFRNSHNYLNDATQEMACIRLLEDILPWLREAKLSTGSYPEAYLSLSHLMEDAVERFRGAMWTDVSRAYFHEMAYYMRLWLQACRTICGA